MYYVINTMSAVQGNSMGTVVSAHRTIRAAAKGMVDCQPRERGSYLPVTVVRSDARMERGAHVARSAVEALTESEQMEMAESGR